MSARPNFTPAPGEVWICTENYYSRSVSGRETINERLMWDHFDKPLIVLFITQSKIHYVQAGAGPDPHVHWLVISQDWHWLEHFARVWPPAPSWDQLRAEGLLAAGAAEEVR